MAETPEDDKPVPLNRRVHLANERTFLAWIRTSIGIMAFGFVVERFALFMKQFSFLLEKSGEASHFHTGHIYSSVFGIILIALGVIIAVLAFVRYKKFEQRIDERTFQPSYALDTLLVLSVMITGIFLVFFLFRSL